MQIIALIDNIEAKKSDVVVQANEYSDGSQLSFPIAIALDTTVVLRVKCSYSDRKTPVEGAKVELSSWHPGTNRYVQIRAGAYTDASGLALFNVFPTLLQKEMYQVVATSNGLRAVIGGVRVQAVGLGLLGPRSAGPAPAPPLSLQDETPLDFSSSLMVVVQLANLMAIDSANDLLISGTLVSSDDRVDAPVHVVNRQLQLADFKECSRGGKYSACAVYAEVELSQLAAGYEYLVQVVDTVSGAVVLRLPLSPTLTEGRVANCMSL